MPPKKRGKRGRAEEQLEAEPKSKRQKVDSQNRTSLKRGNTSALNTSLEATGLPEISQNQQQRQPMPQFDYAVNEISPQDANKEQDAQKHNQVRTAEAEDSELEVFDPVPFEMEIIQAEEWDVLSPDNRLYALNWSLIRAIGVLEYIHIDLMESQNSERFEASDRGSPLPSEGVSLF